MNSYKDRETVRRLSREYGMPESYVRQMLAIENGVIKGDVRDAVSAPRHGLLIRGLVILASFLTFGSYSPFRPVH